MIARRKKKLITNQAQLIDPEVWRIVFMGRHKPIPGGLATAVLAADTHENNTPDSLPLELRAEFLADQVKNESVMYEKDLQYCPLCRDEYRTEIMQCATCGVELLSGEEMQRRSGDLEGQQGAVVGIEEGDTLVALRKGSLLDMKGLKSVLAGAGIPAELIQDDSCRGGGCCGGPELVLQVRSQDGRKALAVLQEEYERTTGLADMKVAEVEAVYDPEAPVAVCPACAHEFTPNRPDCPDCGLHFLS